MITERMKKSASKLEKQIAKELSKIEAEAKKNDAAFDYQTMLYTFAKKIRHYID